MVINSSSTLSRFRHPHQSISPVTQNLSPNLGCNQNCPTNSEQQPQRSLFGIQQLLSLENNSTSRRILSTPYITSPPCANRLDESFTSLSVSNLISTSVHQNQCSSANYITSKNSSHSNHPLFIASHHQVPTNANSHCYPDPTSSLAYLNSPAAAALISASIQASSNNSAAAAAACMAPNVPAPMSMLHSFASSNLETGIGSRNDHTCSGKKFFILFLCYLFLSMLITNQMLALINGHK